MRKLLSACQGVLRAQVDAWEMPDHTMCEAGLAGGNNGACSGRWVAIDGWVAVPVSLYGTTGTCRSADFARSANRSGSEVPYPGLLPLSCLAAVGGDGARTGPTAREHLARLRPSPGPRLRRGTGPRLLRACDTASPVVDSPSPRPVCWLSAAPPGSSRLVGRRIDPHTKRLPRNGLPARCRGWRLPGSYRSPCHRGRTPPNDTAEEGGKKRKREQGHPRANRPSNGAGSNRHPGDSFLRTGQTVLRAQSRTADDMRIPGFPLPTLATLNLRCDSPGVECMSTTLSLSSDRAGTS